MSQPKRHGAERHLAAILSADAHGYSRLMNEDEAATIYTLTVYRRRMTALVAEHGGRVVDSPGDNLLAEFSSAVDAVECAVAIQSALAVENAGLPAGRRMEFRIGINVGDVVAEGKRIYGDGVNVAARLEGLAEPGGVCISGSIYEQVKNKLPFAFDDLGRRTLKNIGEPIRVYRVRGEASTASSPRDAFVAGLRRWRMAALVTAACLALLAAIVALPRLAERPDSSMKVRLQPPADRPSIAVLPFTNLSGDPAQEYFSDGITQDLTTDLSKLSGLFVIAYNSVGVFKGKTIDVGEVGRDLGVRYVLEGSVRKAGDRLRVTAQLVEAENGRHLWADRYDRELKDVFAVQDEITEQIVLHLRVEVQQAELARVRRIPTANLTAYDYVLRGSDLMYRSRAKGSIARAREMFQAAIDLDPNYAVAYGALSWSAVSDWLFYWSSDPGLLEQGLELGRKAVALDELNPRAHAHLAWAYLFKRWHEQALAEAERAIALDPNSSPGYEILAEVLVLSGSTDQAIAMVRKAMRLNPHYPFYYPSVLGLCHLLNRQYDEAIAAMKEAALKNPDSGIDHANLALAYVELGRIEEARAEAREVLRITPHFSIDSFRRVFPHKDPAVTERAVAAFRKAGLH